MPNGHPSKAFMNRYYAYVLTRMTYRDTSLLEEHHVSSAPLNMNFYEEMILEVQSVFDKLAPQINALIEGASPQSEDDKILNDWLCKLLRSMDSWYPPEKVRDRFKGTVAEYVLGGEFFKACSQQLKLDDELMKSLNIDVYNRYYTLVCRAH